MDNKKLFVSGLPWAVTSEDLAEHFAAAGTVVEAIVITERGTNRSKGFGFVTMEETADAEKAIEMFHESEMGGRHLVVNVAKPRE